MPGHADAISFALTFVRIAKFLRKKKGNDFNISQLAMSFKFKSNFFFLCRALSLKPHPSRKEACRL